MSSSRPRGQQASNSCNFTAVVSRGCPATSHGDTELDYLAGCRCPAAREAHRIERGRRHLRALRVGPAHVDPTGTRRRLQALAAAGWSVEDIAAGLGSRPSYVGQLQHRVTPVHRRTAAKVRDFYDRHADRPGPSPRAVHYARRNGWLAPIWWDSETIDDPAWTPPTADTRAVDVDVDVDEVNVARRLAGDRTIRLTQAEKAAAVQQLTAAHVPPWQISERLGVNSVYVHRYANGVA
jgi:hypothetical protein